MIKLQDEKNKKYLMINEIMKIVQSKGYSKEKALAEAGIEIEDPKQLTNATQMWKKSGSPLTEKGLKEFLEWYVQDRKAYGGVYIVLDPASDDTRKRPYNVINEATTERRKTKRMYQVKEAEIKVTTKTEIDENGESYDVDIAKVVAVGEIVGKAEKKNDAVKIMKDKIKENKKDYVIEIVSEVVQGQKYASYGKYVPSKSAEVGTFIFAFKE